MTRYNHCRLEDHMEDSERKHPFEIKLWEFMELHGMRDGYRPFHPEFANWRAPYGLPSPDERVYRAYLEYLAKGKKRKINNSTDWP